LAVSLSPGHHTCSAPLRQGPWLRHLTYTLTSSSRSLAFLLRGRLSLATPLCPSSLATVTTSRLPRHRRLFTRTAYRLAYHQAVCLSSYFDGPLRNNLLFLLHTFLLFLIFFFFRHSRKCTPHSLDMPTTTFAAGTPHYDVYDVYHTRLNDCAENGLITYCLILNQLTTLFIDRPGHPVIPHRHSFSSLADRTSDGERLILLSWIDRTTRLQLNAQLERHSFIPAWSVPFQDEYMPRTHASTAAS
jgi:hypothetical protein